MPTICTLVIPCCGFHLNLCLSWGAGIDPIWNKWVKSTFQGRTLRWSSNPSQVTRTSFLFFTFSRYLPDPIWPSQFGELFSKSSLQSKFCIPATREGRDCHMAHSHLNPFVPPTNGTSHITRTLLLAKERTGLCVNVTQGWWSSEEQVRTSVWGEREASQGRGCLRDD